MWGNDTCCSSVPPFRQLLHGERMRYFQKLKPEQLTVANHAPFARKIKGRVGSRADWIAIKLRLHFARPHPKHRYRWNSCERGLPFGFQLSSNILLQFSGSVENVLRGSISRYCIVAVWKRSLHYFFFTDLVVFILLKGWKSLDRSNSGVNESTYIIYILIYST